MVPGQVGGALDDPFVIPFDRNRGTLSGHRG